MEKLLLVNRDNVLPKAYGPREPKEVGASGIFGEGRAVDALERMIAAMEREGLSPAVVSGYRSYDRQTQLFRPNQQRPYTVAPAGESEHQTGLAFDIASSGHPELEESFGETPEGHWLLEHAPEYGFILRYPKGSEAVTGVVYEPWHYRYAGEHAPAIAARGLTLEEYIEETGS